VKIGSENKKEVIAMVALLAIAIPLVLYNFGDMLWSRGGSPSAASNVAPSTAAQKPGATTMQADIDPRLHLDDLEASRKIKYEPGRNIFEMQQVIIEQPKDSVRTTANQLPIGPPAPPTPTPPPPIPLKFYGFANKSGDPKRVFLQQQGGDHVFVAAQGDVIDRRYKVVQIQATSVVMEDMLTNNRQPIPLTAR
jgi:hypothetical protein